MKIFYTKPYKKKLRLRKCCLGERGLKIVVKRYNLYFTMFLINCIHLMELKNVKNMLQTKWWSIVIKVTPRLKFVLVEQDGVGENQETFGLRTFGVGCSKWSSKVQGQARERPTKCERWGMISGRGLVVSVVCRSGKRRLG